MTRAYDGRSRRLSPQELEGSRNVRLGDVTATFSVQEICMG
jgi:hypothetical protein